MSSRKEMGTMRGAALLLLAATAVLGAAEASLPSRPTLCFAGVAGGGGARLAPARPHISPLRPAYTPSPRSGRHAPALRMSSMFTEDGNGEISVTPLWEDSLDDLDGINVSPEEKERLLKARSALLSATAGLERGSSASKEQRADVELAVKELERCLPYSPSIWPDCIQGEWRLIYSSALSPGSGSGGGASRDSLFIFQTPDIVSLLPRNLGPISPVEIGSVFQNIDLNSGECDNVLEVNLQVPIVNSFLPATTSTARLTLRHSLSFEPDFARRIKIILTQCKAEYADGPLKQLGNSIGIYPPDLTAPVITQITAQGPGIFDTTYCDDELRISKGDRGEIRVFVRER